MSDFIACKHSTTDEIKLGWASRDASSPRQVFTNPRFLRRALLLAGRLPWLAFFNTRCGLAITIGPYQIQIVIPKKDIESLSLQFLLIAGKMGKCRLISGFGPANSELLGV
ncbi:MAG: hypothetical protein ABSG67_11525 [Thermoguttaceae bacterium]|jgi:hypothetical protein